MSLSFGENISVFVMIGSMAAQFVPLAESCAFVPLSRSQRYNHDFS
jgi:hypothetical protein